MQPTKQAAGVPRGVKGGSLIAAAAAAMLALGGCVPSGFLPSLSLRAPANDALVHTAGPGANGAWPAPDWVKQLQDPQLDDLVAEASQHNPDLQVAQARLRIAQAQLQQFDSLTGLTGTAGATISRARMPKPGDIADVTAGGYRVPVQIFGDPNVSPSSIFVGLNYQLDLWGKNRAATKSLMSLRDAAGVEAEQVRLTLAVAIVTVYCQLDQAYAVRDLLQQKLKISQRVTAVLRERTARGLDNAYDASDASIKRSRLLEQIALNDEQIKLAQLQLGVLSGRGPERGLALQRPRVGAFAGGAVPARLPADLLGRRPDIVAARLRVEAAFANADSTRAQFYPDVNLVALGGVFALTPASLFSRDSLAGSVGPAISLPIFDRGRLKAKLGADVAQADVAIGLYNKTVDDALGQVAQLVTSLQTSQTLVAQQQEAVAAAQKIVQIAADRHRRGVLMQKDVDVADLTLIDERTQMIALLGKQRMLRVGLIGALGGGFDAGATVAQAQTPAVHRPRGGAARRAAATAVAANRATVAGPSNDSPAASTASTAMSAAFATTRAAPAPESARRDDTARPSTIGATRPDAAPRGTPVLARTAAASPARSASPMPAIPVFQHDRLIVTQSD
ncbi:efflux transporter outer membrane subunit [Burkholderia cenocepacia]|jgi:NodT family efflux transporter outer membrane factor (OMF) lipoprotein|uniref:efflux transporter outer membrane subunit n=1 Tax=Burkholderia cenocepacia TaxID=95486 RepID=UPI0004F8175C|nr:efflux transporter outer membrane subunit [Burkholderia cenocepacia]AIO45716.1 efflux transporter, outer membrane factor (OMF) lipo, NodT family protein [Burkholderia cepacia]AMU12970.1 RND transporter [Burkholderia cenocepacia]KGC01040.1 efflux transporter, outer membrane factor (OMF) lipo, NodT family protein [Burkholderia cepacia]MCG0576605.1 efflux transporter outer membrane subunit [Burkholderia cenocepacia]MCW3523163.1 efflux transporter outer membrane subunit [Burkholderia cenocepaci